MTAGALPGGTRTGGATEPQPALPRIAPPRAGFVVIAGVPPNPNQVMLKLGYGSPMVTPDSYPGVVLEPRPKRKALVTYDGGLPIGVSIPFTLGSLRIPDPARTERDVRKLEGLAGVGARHMPRLCVVHGAGAVPYDYVNAAHLRWRIEALTFDQDAERRESRPSWHGRRIWCVGELVMRQDVTDQTLAGLSPATAQNRDEQIGATPGGSRDGGGGRRYTVKEGDTLRKIAKRFDLSKSELADLKRTTGIRDIDQRLRVGRVITLPKPGGSR